MLDTTQFGSYKVRSCFYETKDCWLHKDQYQRVSVSRIYSLTLHTTHTAQRMMWCFQGHDWRICSYSETSVPSKSHLCWQKHFSGFLFLLLLKNLPSCDKKSLEYFSQILHRQQNAALLYCSVYVTWRGGKTVTVGLWRYDFNKLLFDKIHCIWKELKGSKESGRGLCKSSLQKDNSPRFENSVIIYSPKYHSKTIHCPKK